MSFGVGDASAVIIGSVVGVTTGSEDATPSAMGAGVSWAKIDKGATREFSSNAKSEMKDMSFFTCIFRLYYEYLQCQICEVSNINSQVLRELQVF